MDQAVKDTSKLQLQHTHLQIAQIVKAMEYIYHHRTEHLKTQELADVLKITRSYFSTLFKKETGISVSDFIRKEKIKAAANMLRFSEYAYGDIAEYFGFASQSHFIQCFHKEMGVTPKEYRKNFRLFLNSGMAVSYVV